MNLYKIKWLPIFVKEEGQTKSMMIANPEAEPRQTGVVGSDVEYAITLLKDVVKGNGDGIEVGSINEVIFMGPIDVCD